MATPGDAPPKTRGRSRSLGRLALNGLNSIAGPFVRSAVSRDRRRVQGSLDGAGGGLDMSYITSKVIAMATPAAPGSVEILFRNGADQVCSFLDSEHGYDNWLVFNLVEPGQTSYDVSQLRDRVLSFPFPDHHAPPLDLLLELLLAVRSWLKSSPQHVAIVHCKGGKGRTGTICASYLFFDGLFESVDAAADHFAYARSAIGLGVTQPSQLRSMRYVERVLCAPATSLPTIEPYLITNVRLCPVPQHFRKRQLLLELWDYSVRIDPDAEKLPAPDAFVSTCAANDSSDMLDFVLPDCPILCRDILLRVRDAKRERLHLIFHPSFIGVDSSEPLQNAPNEVSVMFTGRSEIDQLDKHFDDSFRMIVQLRKVVEEPSKMYHAPSEERTGKLKSAAHITTSDVWIAAREAFRERRLGARRTLHGTLVRDQNLVARLDFRPVRKGRSYEWTSAYFSLESGIVRQHGADSEISKNDSFIAAYPLFGGTLCEMQAGVELTLSASSWGTVAFRFRVPELYYAWFYQLTSDCKNVTRNETCLSTELRTLLIHAESEGWLPLAVDELRIRLTSSAEALRVRRLQQEFEELKCKLAVLEDTVARMRSSGKPAIELARAEAEACALRQQINTKMPLPANGNSEGSGVIVAHAAADAAVELNEAVCESPTQRKELAEAILQFDTLLAGIPAHCQAGFIEHVSNAVVGLLQGSRASGSF